MSDIPEDIYLPQNQNREAATPGVLIMTTDKVEDLEFFYPYYRFIEAGYRVDVVTPNGGELSGKHGLTLQSTRTFDEIAPADYDLLYIPGGKAPAQLKGDNDALELVKFFQLSNRLISAICHGPQVLAAANVIRGRRLTGWPEIADEIIKAGATYLSEETVRDGALITARWPGDLSAHMKHTLDALAQAGKEAHPSMHAAA
jgi:protease I